MDRAETCTSSPRGHLSFDPSTMNTCLDTAAGSTTSCQSCQHIGPCAKDKSHSPSGAAALSPTHLDLAESTTSRRSCQCNRPCPTQHPTMTTRFAPRHNDPDQQLVDTGLGLSPPHLAGVSISTSPEDPAIIRANATLFCIERRHVLSHLEDVRHQRIF